MAHTSDASVQLTNSFNARRLGLTIVLAAVLNLIIYGIGSAAGAVWIANDQSITWILVIVATAIPVTIGWTITFLLARRWVKAWNFMAWVGLIFGIVTVPAPLLSTGDSVAGWALAIMHAITGIVWFVAVRPRRHPIGG